MNLPLGYRFGSRTYPFLHREKGKDLPMPWNCSIVERDLYEEHATPWNLFSNNPGISVKLGKKRSFDG